jgi:hypothetical protein
MPRVEVTSVEAVSSTVASDVFAVVLLFCPAVHVAANAGMLNAHITATERNTVSTFLILFFILQLSFQNNFECPDKCIQYRPIVGPETPFSNKKTSFLSKAGV